MPLADYLSVGFILVYQAAVSIMGTAVFLLSWKALALRALKKTKGEKGTGI